MKKKLRKRVLHAQRLKAETIACTRLWFMNSRWCSISNSVAALTKDILMQSPPRLLSAPSFLSSFLRLHSSASTLLLLRRPTEAVRVAMASSSSDHRRPQMESESFKFGPYRISQKEVFFSNHLSFAFVNIRPVVPDVLVCPIREVKRFVDLTADETSDLWLLAHKIGRQLESYHKASSLTYTIQDGPESGQSVPHVHVHILPRKSGDLEKNDEICDAVDLEKELKRKLDLDLERKDRSIEEMAKEADEYRRLFF